MKIVKEKIYLDLEDFLAQHFAYQFKPLSNNPKMSLRVFAPGDEEHKHPLAEMSVQPINAHVMIQEGASQVGVQNMLAHIQAWENYSHGEALVVFPDEVIPYP